MKSQKITLTIAEHITDRICDRDDNLWDWMAQGIELQVFAYQLWLKKHSKYLPILKQLPSSWQTSLTSKYVSFSTNDSDCRRFERIRMHEYLDLLYGEGVVLLSDEEMDELQKRIEIVKELHRAYRENRKKVFCAIQRYSTTKQLVEGWSDIEQIVHEVLHELNGSISRPLVVQNIEELNQIFKLPPQENNVPAQAISK
jgi:hypothetical protein